MNRFLGQVVDEAAAAPVVHTPSLPSSESVSAALRREPGAWAKVASSTMLRAVLIAPGMWVAGGRGWRLALGALTASVSITAFIFLFYHAARPPRPEPTNAQ